MAGLAELAFGILCLAGGPYCIARAFRQDNRPYRKPPSAWAMAGLVLLGGIGLLVGMVVILPALL